VPVQVSGGIRDGRLRMEWSYGAHRYRRATVEGLARRFEAILRRALSEAAADEPARFAPSDFPLAGLDATSLPAALAGRNAVEDLYPLSPLQEGLLFHSLYEPDDGLYVGQLDCVLEGDLDVEAFEAAWQHLVDRHPIFRTCFLWRDLDRPLQLVLPRAELPLDREDWRGLDAAERARRLAARLDAGRAAYDLERAPLMRLSLCRLDDSSYHLVWSHHHLLLDGWAVALLANEVFEVYQCLRAGRRPDLPPVRPYRDYIEWLGGQDLEAARRHWRETLRGFRAPTSLDAVRSPRPEESRRGLEDHWLALEPEATASLRAWLRAQGMTVSTLVQGVWGTILSHLSGEEDVVFGATVAGRPTDLEGFERMIGLFINTLPVRVRSRPEAGLAAWLQDLQREQVEGRRYEFTPLVEIQGQSELPRGTPLFESVLVVENYPMDESHERSFAIRDFRYLMIENFPLIFTVLPGTELRIKIKYQAAELGRTAVERLASLFLAALRTLAARPEATVQAVAEALAADDREHHRRSGETLRRARQQAFERSRRRSVPTS
ncbi:MAG TPA: condensation domain-containing protein, partial [Thermoanaerobaculia bacterium]|nr:condensation domain-containing protein [Thermoanaerobaculia bacterium]